MRDDGYTGWLVMCASQHGGEPRVLAGNFPDAEEAQEWIDANKDTHPYLPYVEPA